MKLPLSLILTLFLLNVAFSQDKLLLKNRDTLSVKVLSIENQKVNYQLTGKSVPETSEVANLHKIIWRNGKELVFDEIFDERLRKENIPKPKEIVVVSKKQDSPKLSYKGKIFTRFYENGEKISKYRVKEIIQFYGKTNLPLFQEGLNYEDRAKKVGGGILGALGVLSVGRETLSGANNVNATNSTKSNSKIFGGVLIAGFVVSGITYTIMHVKANLLMQVAVDNYNSKLK